MGRDPELLADIVVRGQVIIWRGPAPYFFVAVPPDHVDALRYAARLASYGWGVVPVEAQTGETVFQTSLFPRNGGYFIPLRAAVRKREGIDAGDEVEIRICVRGRPLPV